MKPTVVRNLFLAALLLAQLAAVALLVVALQGNLTARVNTNARDSLSQLAANVTDQTRLFLAQAEGALTTGSLLIADGVIRTTDDHALERFFIAQLRSSEWLNGMYLGRRDGSFVFVSRHAEGIRTKVVQVGDRARHTRQTQYDPELNVLLRWPSPHDKFDPRNRPWYLLARATDGIAWTNAYQFYSSGKPGLSAARAVDYKGRDAGVMGVDVDIAALSAFLSRLPGDSAGSAVLVDNNRHVIASSSLERLTASMSAGKLPGFDNVADKPLQALAAAQAAERPEPGLDPGFASLTVDGTNYYGIARPFTLTHSAGQWHLYVQLPQMGLAGGLTTYSAHHLQWLLALIVIPALMAAGLFYHLSRTHHRHLPGKTRDGLTGALNRPDFERRLKRLMVDRRGKENSTLIVAAVDIDNFNRINSQFGHHAGDVILRTAVDRLRKHLRREDLICRTSGDHFLVATRVDRHQDALPTMHRLHQAMVSEPVSSNVAQHEIGATIGVAWLGEGETVHELMLRAGQALLTGKLSGKNRCYLAAHFHDLLDTPDVPATAATARPAPAVTGR